MSEPLDELGALRRWLVDLRATVERKAEGLSPEQLAARSVPPSDLSVLGWSGTWRRWSTTGS